MIPIELCRIAPKQRCPKKLSEAQLRTFYDGSDTTRHTPAKRKFDICEIVSGVIANEDPILEHYGIKIEDKMTSLTARVIPPPKIVYRGEQQSYTTVVPENGRWNLRDKFFDGISIKSWALVCCAQQHQVSQTSLRNFVSQLRNVGKMVGMPFVFAPSFCKYVVNIEHIEPVFKYLSQMSHPIQLVVVVLTGKTAIYGKVKRVGDTQCGLTTQCIHVSNVVAPVKHTLINLCMKINIKLGGVNSVAVNSVHLPALQEPVLFIGANVMELSRREGNGPMSVSCVVGSAGGFQSRFTAAVRVQKDTDFVIEQLSSMVRELILNFFRMSNFKPRRIVYYRDHVHENLLEYVLQYEIRAIRDACLSIEKDYNPAITFITVHLTHRSRLFPATVEEQDNVPAGTVVDTVITSKEFFDFYLVSHSGMKGTSRPTRYQVLWDDSRMTADEIQQLTYFLCHTQARCTRSISIPAPIYYAVLVGQRARLHVVDHTSDGNTRKSDLLPHNVAQQVVEIHERMVKKMYFA
ncbi:unnamed protein product [Caenorhabditis auriculariae]|uniref:Piwi domain-containing protein n=1 Tax=Caenorhabditis auriculariae TaxID=2777116 RepID=A0A8S1GRS2_9PELO|nr:unnamed protein product [Caenorhabditis auriculariae]